MPIQAPQWMDYLNCPVCCREFGAPPRCPISLGCGHTICRHCLNNLHRRQCPFDQTDIQVDNEELVVNTALLQLAGFAPPPQPYQPPGIQALPETERQAYDVTVRCMESLSVFLKFCANGNNTPTTARLSRPMQRKLVTLLQCAITDEEGRGRAARAARSLGERTVTELILQHQNPQQLSANLWAAVRARGCQFLGPSMQEEVLKLVLLALEDGSALSRKVLVMFVVQRLEPHFPQASKTSIGHVVQLLYRASCFKVSKRESDSSLMQLKEEFRTYEALRREHDAQIVQIATEAGLRIAPDQWSSLLYGDVTHKSHMQSIIDKLQTPQSFAQSVQELFIALQRTGDPAQLVEMSMHLDRLASIDPTPDAKSPTTWLQLADMMTSLREVVTGLVHYLQQQRDSNHNQPRQPTTAEPSSSQPQTSSSTPTHAKYKCQRSTSCAFNSLDLERYRRPAYLNMDNVNGHQHEPPPPPPQQGGPGGPCPPQMPSMPMSCAPQPVPAPPQRPPALQPPMLPRYPVPRMYPAEPYNPTMGMMSTQLVGVYRTPAPHNVPAVRPATYWRPEESQPAMMPMEYGSSRVSMEQAAATKRFPRTFSPIPSYLYLPGNSANTSSSSASYLTTPEFASSRWIPQPAIYPMEGSVTGLAGATCLSNANDVDLTGDDDELEEKMQALERRIDTEFEDVE